MPLNDETATRRWRRRATCALASTAMFAGGAVALAGPAAAAGPQTILVSNGGQDVPGCGATPQSQCATIQYGVDQASAGDTVQVAAGTYSETVNVTKALTLQGAGAGLSVIDGTGQPSTNYGTVNFLQPGGDVTFSGFTVQNPVASGNGQAFDVTLNDSTPSDTATFTDNSLLGDSNATDNAANAPIGIDSANVAADQVIEDNDVSGVYQGILLEGSSGAIDVSGNTFHDLTTNSGTDTDGSYDYPAEGVYVLSDSGVDAAGQNITGNTFRGYGGIGIKYSAGYNLGGCTARVCDGTVSGSVTGNTFALTATAADSDLPGAALDLVAVHSGDALNLTVGGNTGTVVAPTLPIIESANNGAVNVSPGATPNTITTDPAPTVATAVPASITTDEPAIAFSGAATNTSGEDLPNARYDVTITGTSGITANQLDLEYNDGTSFVPVPLTGTASAGDAITGYFGPKAGFTFPAAATPTTDFTVSVPQVSAPAGPLTVTISLDQVSSGTGNPVIDTLASEQHTTTIVDNSAPVATGKMVTTPIGTAVPITLDATDADGDALTYTHTAPADGTLTGSGANLTFAPASGFVGSTSFAFAASDSKAGSDTATITIVVGKATSAITATVSPAAVTIATAPTLTVKVTRTPAYGTVEGGNVTVLGSTAAGTTFGLRKPVSGGQAIFTLPKLPVGTTSLVIDFAGTSTTTDAEITKTISVGKVNASISSTTVPSPLKSSATKTGKIKVTYSAPGGTVNGALARLYLNNTLLSQITVASNATTFGIYRTLAAGTYTFQVRFPGTSTVNSFKTNITVKVVKG